MKFTFSWLKDFLETSKTPAEIIDGLNKIGLEVEEVITQEDIYKPFIVAEIISAIPHPEADKLQVCQVNNGEEIIQIVCGAPNVRAGIRVVLAPIGAEIPSNSLKIKESKIRNVNSYGMLCSAKELELGENSDGIIELDETYLVGSLFGKAHGLDEVFIDISITPNRGDCLGVYGIARDLAAAGFGKLKDLNIHKIDGSFTSPLNVKLDNPQICSKYIGRYFKNVNNISSPQWLEKRLKLIGLKPISALVDITNYFTFAYGRPLHVYDADTIIGNIVVREAKLDESLLALNDKSYCFKAGEGIISDNEKPLAIAGIIGGKNSSVSVDSKNIFLEIGYFDSDLVTKAARLHAIDTDAKYRFERKVDPLFLEPALDLATQMIMDICGGSPSKPVIIDNLKFIPTRIDFNLSLLKKKIGIEYNKATVVNILQNLGFKLESNGGEQIILSIPSWRPDISLKDNIVGEIARIDGFEHIAAIALPMLNKFTVILDNKQSHIYRLQRFAASLGLDETVTFSFMHSVKAKLFGALSKELHIKNPISSELDYMRPSILPNLLEAAEKNQNRGINNIALFEMGSVFTGIKPEQQISSLTGLRTGFNNDRNVYKDLRAVDLFDCKADILAILAEAGLDPNKPQLVTDNLPLYYHPGRAAALTLGKNILGYFGELHPKIIQNYNLHGNAVGFELFLENIPLVKSKFGRKSALQASDYQAVERDFAFLVKEDISIDNITRSVMQIDKKLIKSIDVFDIYTGKGVENGYKSIAFSVTIQALDHTLSEQEIEDLSKKIIASVIENTNGSLRGV